MTAPVPDPRFRDQLAEEMWAKHDRPATGIPWEDVSAGTKRMWLRWASIVAAEVEARVRAAVNQRAAEELRKAATEVRGYCVYPYGYDLAAKLDDRAAALASPAPAPSGEEGQR